MPKTQTTQQGAQQMNTKELTKIIENALKKSPLYLHHAAAEWSAHNVIAEFQREGIVCTRQEKPEQPQRRHNDVKQEPKL